MIHIHISARQRPFELKLREVWEYRHLIRLFTERTFRVSYAQTVLGPLWLFINPLITAFMYTVVFGNIAGLSTDGLPQLLFYLTGNAFWGYFSACLNNNASTFTGNAHLFGKVYFPRLTVPVSNVLSACIRFGIQMVPALLLIFYYVLRGVLAPHWLCWLALPLLLAELGIMGMGIGILISSMTTKYRDLSVLVGFGMSLWMYATPVVYPLSTLSGTLRQLSLCNPLTAPMELFRYALLGTGTILPLGLLYSVLFTALMILPGIAVFNRVERTFMDTV